MDWPGSGKIAFRAIINYGILSETSMRRLLKTMTSTPNPSPQSGEGRKPQKTGHIQAHSA
jgi:hypothetical protein